MILESRLLAVETAHGALCPLPQEADRTTVDTLSERDLQPLRNSPHGAMEIVRTLNHRVFGELGIKSSLDLKDPCNLLPSGVLTRKQGYCVGIAALYLILAERLALPIHAVATPSHVFLRFDDGTTRINIETLQGGASISDEQYVREHKISERSIRGNVFMRNLTADEFLAQVHNNLGIVHSERKEFEAAAIEYDRALDLDPWLPAAWYNYGKDLLRLGESRKAARYFSRALRLNPADAWALNNRGLAYSKIGQREKARRDFEEALRIEPGFEQARRNLQSIQ
jgi:regulator of sirC expression with transglutaminase-like and TPR domain